MKKCSVFKWISILFKMIQEKQKAKKEAESKNKIQ